MQQSICLISTLILFVIINFTACGNNYSDTKKTMQKQTLIFENYINSMNKADNADDLVKAINAFSESMNDIIPELNKIAKQHPELAVQNEPPEELKEEYDKIATFSEKISATMMKNLKYLSDPKVQKAIQEQGRIMTNTIEKG